MSSENVMISVRGLGKSYAIARTNDRPTTLAEATLRRLRRPLDRKATDTFWALNDISFDVRRGDVVGVVGRNGAGKSTLLKVLSRITEPTAGQVELYGRVGSLLEVGTGFHPELSGRENVYLNGSILGMTRAEINREFDAIVDFAGTGAFLDTPVKRYSSGMYVRLAFAVAAHLRSEVLIVDEVLAVGDAEFQRKCLGRMKTLAKDGRTVLLVSHNVASVTNLCNQAILLHNGCLAAAGATADVMGHYAASEAGPNSVATLSASRPSWATPCIQSAQVIGVEGGALTRFGLGDPVGFEMTFRMPDGGSAMEPVMGVVVNHSMFGTVGGVNTRMTGFRPTNRPARAGVFRCRLDGLCLLHGRYTVDLWFGDGQVNLDTLNSYLQFEVEATDLYRTGRSPFGHMGVVFLRPQWTFEAAEPTLSAGGTL